MTKNEKNSKVPRLRFKDENGENYPEWEMKKLGEVANFEKGKQINKDQLSEIKTDDFPYPLYNGGIIQSGYFNKSNNDGYHVTISEGGNAGYVRYVKGKFWSGGHNYIVKNISSSQNFIFQILKYLEKTLQNNARGTTIKNLQKKEINQISIYIPSSLSEQEKIAGFLSALDENIEANEELLELLKVEKTGYLQKIFNRELRFMDDNGKNYPEWEIKKIGSVLIPVSYERLKNPENYNLLTVKLHTQGVSPTDNKPKPTEKGRPYYQRSIGEFLIGKQNFHNGGFGIVKEDTNNYIASNAIAGYTINQNPLFILNYFQSSYKKFDKYLEGTGQKEIPQRIFNSIPIPVPSLPEQGKIAGFLSALDDRIEAQSHLVSTLKEEKKAYLQRIFG